jgi:hypothetical protein
VAITFQRAALYEEVWSEPLPTLAKKYGLSDNGLRKICKALSIPLPAAGYWAKRAAGDPAPRTALPPTAERTSFTSNPPAPHFIRPTMTSGSSSEIDTSAARMLRSKWRSARPAGTPWPQR